MLYAFTENFILPFSHDEVVHGKGSMLDKMPGDAWQKYATLRTLYGYMYGHPGQEAAVHGQRVRPVARVEPRRSLDWHLLDDPSHAALRRYVQDAELASIAREPALHECDFDPAGFRWIDCNDNENSVVVVRPLRARSARLRRDGRSTSRRCRAPTIASACRSPATTPSC